MVTDCKLIEHLGGPSAVARLCRVTASAVTNWVRRGAIPAEHHVALWREAVSNDIDWTPPGAADLVLRKREAA